MSSLSAAAAKTPTDYTTTEEYRVFIDTMIPSILSDSETRQIEVTPETGYLYRGNLTAFLLDNQIPLEDHFIVRRLNNITHPHEFGETTDYLIIPGVSLIARLKQIYRTRLN